MNHNYKRKNTKHLHFNRRKPKGFEMIKDFWEQEAWNELIKKYDFYVPYDMPRESYKEWQVMGDNSLTQTFGCSSLNLGR